MFNYEEDIVDRYFRFNLFSDCGGGSEHALFHVYLLSESNVDVIEDINVYTTLYNDYKSFLVGKNSVVAVQSVLQRFSLRYNGFNSFECFKMLDSNVCRFFNKVGHMEVPKCVAQSNQVFQIAYRFQQFVSLRVGFIEGAHRHLCYFRQIYNMNLLTVGEDVVTSKVFFVRLEEELLDDQPTSVLCNELLIRYNTYVDILSDPNEPTSDKPAADPDTILTFAREASKKSMDVPRHSVFNDDVHE